MKEPIVGSINFGPVFPKEWGVVIGDPQAKVLFECRLPLPPSVNSLYGGGSGQQRFMSKRYKEWVKSCPALKPINITEPVKIIYGFTWPCNRRRDGQSYLKATTDFLVNQGVLEDDNYQIVTSETWLHHGVDKNNGCVYITIQSV